MKTRPGVSGYTPQLSCDERPEINSAVTPEPSPFLSLHYILTFKEISA